MCEHYLGIISGTSLDAVDVACLKIANEKPQFVNAIAVAIPEALQKECRDIIRDKHCDLNQLLELDVQLGQLFAHASQQLLQQCGLAHSEIAAIGSHGQTIFHHPDSQYPSTLQLGDPNVIAEQTGITVVADFRRRDIAAGGQGAPLVPIFHNVLTGNDSKTAVVNIGGIANITCQSQSAETIGYDTGPGNGLMDAYCRAYLKKDMDNNGELAKTGTVNPDLLEQLLQDAYFSLPVPKSTGSEYFNLAWFEKFLRPSVTSNDVLATLAELTAMTIARAVSEFSVTKLYVCGGGAQNSFLLSRIQHHLKGVLVESTTGLGIHPDWIEASAFAYMAYLTLAHKKGNLASVTGARRNVILGGIYLSDGTS